MVALVSVFLVVTLSILVTRVATIALTHTGLARSSASFQARSAFTGVGFTTREAEQVVNHPVRRRIVMLLMMLGNAGIITGASSLILSFVNLADSPLGAGDRLAILAVGLLALWLLARSRYVDRWLSWAIELALSRWTRLDVRDYAALLHVSGDYGVREMQVETDDWLADSTLEELRLRREGVSVLGITRQDGTYVGVPRGSTRVEAGDTLILYGRAEGLAELDERRSGTDGQRQHEEAVAEQQVRDRAQDEADRARRTRRTS